MAHSSIPIPRHGIASLMPSARLNFGSPCTAIWKGNAAMMIHGALDKSIEDCHRVYDRSQGSFVNFHGDEVNASVKDRTAPSVFLV
mmetsp:Transcript_15054/g.35494  ORF Transcript_15054/g.35494 Transcript_15054/m.35494 type:complete len:86 (-) Transcript_15054:226-483(-)